MNMHRCHPALNLEAIPDELRRLDDWVVWVYRPQLDRIAKMPLQPATLRAARVTDPATWGTFDQASQAYLEGHVDGIGIVLADGAGLVAVDIDDCVDPATGELSPFAEATVRHLHTYAEFSPSGTGVHLLAFGAKPDGACRSSKGVEMYSTARYVTVTGWRLPGAPPGPRHRTAAIAEFHAQHFSPRPPARNFLDTFNAPIVPPEDVHELLERMFRSRHGDRIRALFEGDTSAYQGDHSRADLALVARLGHWTNYDRDLMDRLFRMSALYRPEKWDRRHSADGRTYGQLTIDKACQNRTQGRSND